MPALAELLAKRAGIALEIIEEAAILASEDTVDAIPSLEKRIDIPYDESSPPGLIEANTVDPW